MTSSNKTSQHHTRVAYRPLTDLAKIDELDLEAGGGGGGGEEDDQEEELEVAANNQLESSGNIMTKDYASTTRRSYHLSSKQHTRQVLIGLRQLRTILLALAALLSFIFLLKLITYSSPPIAKPPASKLVTSPQPAKPISAETTLNHLNALNQIMSTNTTITSNKNLNGSGKQPRADAEKRPEYDNYLSSIIYERDHKMASRSDGVDDPTGVQPSEELLDDFGYSLGDRRTTQDGSQLDQRDEDNTANTQNYRWWSIGKRGGDRYTTVINFIRPMKSFNGSTSVTLATHLILGVQSFRHTLELCERWQGPISVAVYLSRGLNYELPSAITLIKFVRQCLPAPLSACMRDKITWHLVFESDNLFAANSLSYPKYHLDAIHYSAFANTDQCPKLAAQDGGSGSGGELINLFERDILEHNAGSSHPSINISKKNNKLIPENVLRNVARSTVKTKWVLTSSVDMYPSLDMAPRFINLAASLDQSRPRLFVLPTFELINCIEKRSSSGPSRTKQELVELIAGGRARVYQEPNCDRCHVFGRMQDWLTLSPALADSGQNALTIFETLTSEGESENRGMWQPLFLAESQLLPNYNEALASDRSEVTYETCLEGYQPVVLADAFLVRQCQGDKNQHVFLSEDKELRGQQRRLISQAQLELRLRYKDSPNINKC